MCVPRSFAPMPMRCLVLLVLMLSFLPQADAQLRTVPYWGFGLMGGASWYAGDLTTSDKIGFPSDQLASLKYTSYHAGGTISYQWHPHMGLRLAGAFGRLTADDAKSDTDRAKARGLKVETDIVEFSLQWTYDFLGGYKGILDRPTFTPYVFAGVGAVWYRPGATLLIGELNGRVDLREYRTEGQTEAYSKWTPVIPFGMGVRTRLAPRWDLRMELGLRKTFTDYLDDVSGATEDRGGRFATPEQLGSGAGASTQYNLRTYIAYQTNDPNVISQKQNLRRGNPETDDWYAFGGISIVYLIEARESCPKPPKARSNKGFLFF